VRWAMAATAREAHASGAATATELASWQRELAGESCQAVRLG